MAIVLSYQMALSYYMEIIHTIMEIIDAYTVYENRNVWLYEDNICKYMELKHDYMELIDAIT